MLQKVRKRIVSKAIIKIIVCIAVIVGTLLFTDMAPIKWVKGPEKIDIDSIDLAEYDGKYVEADITYVYDCFLEKETYKKYKDGSRSEGEISARYYITDVNLSQYLALLADGTTLMDEFEVLMNNTETALDNDTEPESTSYKGTFMKLSEREYTEFKSFMTQVGMSEDMYSDYIFKVNYVGKFDEAYPILGCGVIIFAALFALLSLIRSLSGRYAKEARKFAIDNGLTFEQLSMELDGAYETGNVWITSRYTAYLKGNKIRVLNNQNYIWAYYKETRTTRRGSTSVTSQIALADRNKRFTFITIGSEEEARSVLSIYSETQPQIVLGFNDDLQNLFRVNFDQFLMLPNQKTKSDEETAPSEETVQSEETAPSKEAVSSEESVSEKYVPESYTDTDSTDNSNLK